MQRHRYLTPRLHVAAPLASGTHIALPPDAAHHALNVLRLREGEQVTVFNGEGGEYPATLQGVSKKGAGLLLGAHSPVERETRFPITLVQGLSSTDRMDYTVQKAVELGVAAVQAVSCEKSVVRLTGERAASRVAHWQRIAIAACEQCGRNRVPEILPIAEVKRYRPPEAATKLVLAPDGETSLGKAFDGTTDAVILAVGPEAGFSEKEEADLVSGGFRPVTLGSRILRTETAGPVAIAALLSLSGQL